MTKISWTALGLMVVMLSCSKPSNVSDNNDVWVIDPLFQKFRNPVLTLSVVDSQLLVVGYANTTLIDSFLDSSRTGITLRSLNNNSRYKRPIASNTLIYSHSVNSEDILLDGWSKNSPGYLVRSSIEFHDIDSTMSHGYSMFTSIPDRVVGAVSEDDYLMTALMQNNYQKGSLDACGSIDFVVISKIEIDQLNKTSSRNIEVDYIRVIPFQVGLINKLKYYNQHFYIATQNGILKISKNGSSKEWLLHIDSDCSVSFSIFNSLLSEPNDSLRNELDSLNYVWDVAGNRKNIVDFELKNDSIFALQDNGTLWVSSNRGQNWTPMIGTKLSYSTRLVRTDSFFGALFGSQLFKIDIDNNKIMEVNNSAFSNVVINDIAEFKGRLYLATDGGLFSSKISDIKFLKD